MRTTLLAVAASLTMLGTACAMGVGNPNDGASVPSRFVVSIPAVDTGSMAYPSTQDSGASGAVITRGPHFNPALYRHADTGSQQMPVGLH